MGREIRRVPADWEHPRNGRGEYQPLFDESFEDAAREWLDAAIAWDNGTDPDCAEHKTDYPFYWQWNGDPPDPKCYRPKWTSPATHYQVYETVSEGTPVTPHFATKPELVDWLVARGDEWDQNRVRDGRQAGSGWDRAVAEQFVEREWAPSLIAIRTATGFDVRAPRDGDSE